MRISDIIKRKKTTLSFEIFPPKAGIALDADAVVDGLARLKPDFISVTAGAGGGENAASTLGIAEDIKKNYGVESIMHLVCSGARLPYINERLKAAEAAGIDNVLALRGDKINGGSGNDFYHACDLIRVIDKKKFCIGAAAYPEGHVDAPSIDADVEYLRQKAELGADFFTTQLFFDNNRFFEFRERLAKKGINTPLLCGIMPIMSKSQVGRMIFMCGVSLPGEVVKILYKYEDRPEELIRAGIEYAVKQINLLTARGVDGIHIYTMNKPEIARSIADGIRI